MIGERGTGQLSEIASIEAGHAQALALKRDGTVLVRGDGSGAGLGQGTVVLPPQEVPIAVKDERGSAPLKLDPAAYPNLTWRFR